MTSRERLLTTMRGGMTDRVPVAPFQMGRIPIDSDLGRELITRTDPIIDVGAGGPVFLGVGAPATVTQEGDITTTTWQTPRGPLTHRSRSTEQTSATVEFPLKSLEDVERFLSVPYVEPPLDLSTYLEVRDRLGVEGLAMVCVENGVCLPAAWFSPEGFCIAWAERPELVCRLTELASERACAWAEKLCEAGVDAFRVIGGEYVSVQLGPRAFRELIMPFDAELVRVIHRHSAVAHYHNHGRVMRYLSMLAELGIDSLDPLEAAPWGDVTDLAKARELAGERLCFLGNLDDMEIIDALPTDDVLALARERLRQAGDRAFILGGTASGTYGERGARKFIAMAEMVANL